MDSLKLITMARCLCDKQFTINRKCGIIACMILNYVYRIYPDAQQQDVVFRT